MSDERSHFARKIDERTFSQSRRGYDKNEVKAYLEDLEQAFRELEGHSRRLSQRVAELEQELSESRATEKVSLDNAMMAVFDAKDRILERARRKADSIEEDARLEAGRIRQAAIAEVGGAGATGEIAAARAQADEIIASARREADQLRQEVAAAANQGLEADLADIGERLRRAHDENSAVRTELEAARKRIVELENVAPGEDSGRLEQQLAELEQVVSAARAEVKRLQLNLASAQDEREAALRNAEEAEAARSQLHANLEAVTGELAAARARQSDATGTAAPDAQQSRFACTMTAFEAHTLDTFAQVESLALIDEITRVFGGVPPGGSAKSEHAVARAEADRIVATAREEAEQIKAEAEVHAEARSAKVIARAREEADQVRQTVATLTAQAEDARSAALRSKLEAEDLAEAQKAMSEARDQIIATAEQRAEEISQDAERAAAALRAEAAAALARARAEAEQIIAGADQRAGEKTVGAASTAEAGAAPEAVVEPEPQRGSSAESAAISPRQDMSGDELAALLAETEQDLAADDRLRREREKLDAQEADLAAQRAEAILLATSRDDSGVEPAAGGNAIGEEVELDIRAVNTGAYEHPTAAEPVVELPPGEPTRGEAGADDAVDSPPPHIGLNSMPQAPDAASLPDEAEDKDNDVADPADLLTALLGNVAHSGGSDVAVAARPEEVELEPALPPGVEVVEEVSDGLGPRVAWPAPVDAVEAPDGSSAGERPSRYRESRPLRSGAPLGGASPVELDDDGRPAQEDKW